ncbi:hypothetical protein LXT12_10620, partial [Pelomonas sp. P7]
PEFAFIVCVADLSSAAKKRDSNLLFASSSSIFENFFSQYSATSLSSPPRPALSQSSRQQQRGEILIRFRDAVKYFLKLLFRSASSTRRASKPRQQALITCPPPFTPSRLPFPVSAAL